MCSFVRNFSERWNSHPLEHLSPSSSSRKKHGLVFALQLAQMSHTSYRQSCRYNVQVSDIPSFENQRLIDLTATFSASHVRTLSGFPAHRMAFACALPAMLNLQTQMMPSLHNSIRLKTTRQASSAASVRQSSWNAVAVELHSTNTK